jgi:hypothetical protein
MEHLSSITAIGRPVDPRYRTNLVISIITVVVIVIGSIHQLTSGAGVLTGLGWGVVAGLSCFVTWAIGRELDPDYPYSAFVGVVLVMVGIFVYDLPGLLFSFWAILSMRIVNRTCGPPATWLDSIGALGLTLFLVFRDFWLVGLAMTVSFLVDALLDPPNRRHFIFAGLSLMGTILMTVIPSVDPVGALGTGTWVVLGVGGLLMLLVTTTSRKVEAVCDLNSEPLVSQRVQAAQILGLLVGILMVVVDGEAGLVASLPLWSAILGVGLFRVFTVATGRGQGGP